MKPLSLKIRKMLSHEFQRDGSILDLSPPTPVLKQSQPATTWLSSNRIRDGWAKRRIERSCSTLVWAYAPQPLPSSSDFCSLSLQPLPRNKIWFLDKSQGRSKELEPTSNSTPNFQSSKGTVTSFFLLPRQPILWDGKQRNPPAAAIVTPSQ